MATAADSTLTDGLPGVETGGWYPAYFSNLTVTGPDARAASGTQPGHRPRPRRRP